MSEPAPLDALPTLEDQAYVALMVLLVRERNAAIPVNQRHVSLSQTQTGETTVITVAFPTAVGLDGYTPTITVTPWLA